MTLDLKYLRERFAARFGKDAAVAAYAPGRVEMLGNHTDYNEGFVLSAAIDMGTCFVASPSEDSTCCVVAENFAEESRFDIRNPGRTDSPAWSNYVRGVVHGLSARGAMVHGFNAMFLGNVPLGAGLSSSAALEMCTALALTSLYKLSIPDPLDLARIGQQAEHDFAGVQCGLLDQVTSLFGEENSLVLTDFRDLSVRPVALGEGLVLLMCNTHAKHALNDSAYNERRGHCEAAAKAFDRILDHPVSHLRDVSWEAFEKHRASLDDTTARRAAHVIGENTRVQQGVQLLSEGDAAGFGRLMYASHESSRVNFENSCEELDCIVDTAKTLPAVLGARLSGGGFGGSAVILVRESDARTVAARVDEAYRGRFGVGCAGQVLTPSKGAHLVV